MTVLVTGGTGLIGNNVVRLLRERGESVRVLKRATSDSRPLQGLDVEVVTGDVTNADDVRKALVGVACVVHAAAYLHIGSSELARSRAINVESTRHVAQAAREVGARLVHVSSVDALGVGTRNQLADEETQFGEKASCAYVISKREADAVIQDEGRQGLDAVVVHPVFTVGPWDWKPSSGRMLLAIANRFTPFAPSGGHTVADARDVAAGILQAIQHGRSGEHYILGGHQMSYLAFWKLCADVSCGRPPWCRAGPLMRIIGGRFGDLRFRLTGHEPDVNSAALRLTSQFHYYSSRKAERELGYHCRPVRDTVEAAWKWFQAYGYA